VLAFRVPDDLDLIVAASSVAATNGDGVLAGAA
jgi:hypothetical protein